MAKRIILPYEFEPRYYQQRYFDHYDHGGLGGFFLWHRRAGKDLVALHQIAKMAHVRVGMYWHCLPTYAQARKAIWNNFVNSTGRRLLSSVFPSDIVKHPKDFKPQAEMLIELKNGSMIQIIGSDSIDNIVGAGPVHVNFSEYALARPNSYDLVRPMLRENRGSVSFITTPRGKNHAYKVFQTAGRERGWMQDTKSLVDTEAWKLWMDADNVPFTSAEAVIQAEIAGGMQPELARQEYLCDWEAALVGSIFGDLMEQAEKSGRVKDFSDWDGTPHVFFDLGLNDSTAMWLVLVRGDRVDVLGYHEAHGKPLSYYFDEVERWQEKHGFTVQRLWLPHDARAKTLATQNSVYDQFVDRYGEAKVQIVPKLPVIDSIQAGRWLLQQNIRFHKSGCDMGTKGVDGIEVLKQYHYEFDEERRSYTTRPEHDWSSHGADAFRYMGTGIRMAELLSRPRPPPPPKKPVVRTYQSLTLDELFAEHEQALANRQNGRIR